MESTNVALLDLDEALRLRTQQALTEQGLTVFGCSDLASLYRVLEKESAHAVLLRRTDHCAALIDVLLPELRASYPICIVVESLDCSMEDRMQALGAGADLCLDHVYDARELAALICAQTRRSPPASEPVPALHAAASPAEASGHAGGSGPLAAAQLVPALEVWHLLYQGWVLVTPQGRQISLTGVERSFFLALAQDERHELSREALSQGKFNLNFKSISVAISRLRKKVHKGGVRLPLHTVHGMGYVFIGKLRWQDFS
jgi:DNA-binding response OmpR family regulator